MSRHQKAAGLPWPLTRRQEEILVDLCRDPNQSAKQLARSLGRSMTTIRGHLDRARAAMEVSTTLAAVLLYDRFRRQAQPTPQS